tara:strand:- start:12 stop:317 length:306 start_codon:yes stop_codon:yes gene_type:complete
MPIAYPYKFSDWYGYDKDCAALTSFTSSSGTVFSGVCSTILSETYYHNGSGATPVAGDTVYSDSAGGNPLADFYYRIGVKPVIRITGGNGVVNSSWPQAIC